MSNNMLEKTQQYAIAWIDSWIGRLRSYPFTLDAAQKTKLIELVQHKADIMTEKLNITGQKKAKNVAVKIKIEVSISEPADELHQEEKEYRVMSVANKIRTDLLGIIDDYLDTHDILHDPAEGTIESYHTPFTTTESKK